MVSWFGNRSDRHATSAAPADVDRSFVFISYAQDNTAHMRAVRQLYDLLRGQGIDVVFDQFPPVPGRNWPEWCLRQIRQARFVLVVASPQYQRRADSEKQLPEDVGRGVWWEAKHIRDALFATKHGDASKYLPVVLPRGLAADLPDFFSSGDHTYFIQKLSVAGIHPLVQVLRGELPPEPPLGEVTAASTSGWIFAGPEGSEGVRGHIERRGKGQRSTARGGNLFYGRAKALAAVKAWLESPEPPGRVLVVTGQPGAGKSAVVARAALDLDEAVAGERLGLVFHARSATLVDLLHAIAVTTHTTTASSVDGLVEKVRELAPPSRGFWRVVVDALDEAAPDARPELVRALTELAVLPTFRVVVATRAMADSSRRFGPGSLLVALGVRRETDRNLVDVDTDAFFDPSGLVDFAAALLGQAGPPGGAWQTYQNQPDLRQRLAEAIASRAGRNYLVAALIADPLSQQEEVVDPRRSGFDARTELPATIGDALDKYLSSHPKESDQARVRGVLTALAYARGIGIEDKRWLAFAGALGYPATVADLDALRRGGAADYLLQTSTVDGIRLTRLFHQALVEELVASRLQIEDERNILDTLLPAMSDTWLAADWYMRTFAADHATAAGRLDLLLDDAVYPTVADLTRLVPLLPTNASPEVAVLRYAGPEAYELEPPRRAARLALAAAHLGLPALTRRYHQPGNPMIEWAHSRGASLLSLRHDSDVRAVAMGSVNGQDLIVTGGAERTVRLWDAATGARVGGPLTGHTRTVNAVALGVVGGREVIVSGASDRTVRVWDAINRTPILQPLEGHRDSVTAVAAGRVGGREVIVSGSLDGTVRVWDAVTHHPIDRLLDDHKGSVLAVAMGQLGGRDIVVAGSDDNTVQVRDAASGDLIHRLAGHAGGVYAVALGQVDGRDVIVSGSADGTLRVWDATSGGLIRQPLTGHSGSVNAVALGAIGDRAIIVSGSIDRTVRVWDAATRTPIGQPLTGHNEGVRAVAVGRAGAVTVIVSGSDDTEARVWPAVVDAAIGRPLTGHADIVRAVAVGAVGGRAVVVSGSKDRSVRMWGAATGAPIGEFLGHEKRVTAVAVSQGIDGGEIVSGSRDQTVRRWDPDAGEVIGSPLTGHKDMVLSVAAGRADGLDIIVSASRDTTLRVWNARTGAPIGEPFGDHDRGVNAVALGVVGGRAVIVSGGDDQTIRVWNARTGAPIGRPLVGHTERVNAVALGVVDGREVIVSGSSDGTVRVWDAATGSPIGGPLTDHESSVWAVTLGVIDGREVVVSGGADKTVRVWDAATYAELVVLDTFDDVEALASDGARLAIAAGTTIISAILG